MSQAKLLKEKGIIIPSENREQRRNSNRKKFEEKDLMNLLGRIWIFGSKIIKVSLKVFVKIFLMLVNLLMITLDIVGKTASIACTIIKNSSLMVKEHISKNLKSDTGKKNLMIEALCIALLCIIGSNYMISKSKVELTNTIAKQESEIEQYKNIITESEKVIKQFQLIQEKQQNSKETTKTQKSKYNKAMDISTLCVSELNLPAPNPNNFDAKYLSTVKHDILPKNKMIEAMNWIETEYRNNFSNINSKFNPLDVTEVSNLTEKQFLEKINNSSFSKNLTKEQLRQLANGCYKAEKEYKVNGLFLLGLAGLESGWGTSEISKSKNNFTGFSAYDKNSKANAKEFKNIADCIEATANKLKEEYLTETTDNTVTKNINEGAYYNGKSIFDINVNYSSQNNWSTKLVDIIAKF